MKPYIHAAIFLLVTSSLICAAGALAVALYEERVFLAVLMGLYLFVVLTAIMGATEKYNL